MRFLLKGKTRKIFGELHECVPVARSLKKT